MPPDTLSESDPLRKAADSFVARLRRGERPTLAEYTERLPEQATRIREIFPRLLAEERRSLGDRSATGPFGPVESTASIPSTIGDYVIVREIGRGGMGIVYEAVQASLGRQVALKVLPHGATSRSSFIERFRREARAAARLHHTNIVPVFGVGEWEGIHFYGMQYIEGLGLDSVLKEIRRRRGMPYDAQADMARTINLNQTTSDADRVLTDEFELGPAELLPLIGDDAPDRGPVGRGKELIELAETAGPRFYRSVARLGVQAAEALAYAHSQGVLHRDVKPSNFLLDRFGVLWITDFGLAKAEGEDMTGTGDIVGTLRYMAPERFQGRSDSRSDLYALGMTLYEMIALRPAFDDEDRIRLVERITHDKPAALSRHDAKVPRDLETIILKSIQRDPTNRYGTVVELADDLRRYLSDRPILARRASYWEELRRWCRRNPVIAGLCCLVAVLVAVLVGVTTAANFQLRTERDEALNQKQRAESLQRVSDDRLWRSQVSTAKERRSNRRMGQRFDALDALEEARRVRLTAELATSAITSLALPDLRRRGVKETGWPVGSVDVDLDPTFERFARSDRDGNVTVRWYADDAEIVKLPSSGGPSHPRFSRSGAYLVVWHERDGRLTLWRLGDGGSPTRVHEESSNATGSCDFSQDDRQFAVARLDGSVGVFELPTGRFVRDIRTDAPPHSLAFAPTGTTLGLTSGMEVVFCDAVSGKAMGSRSLPSSPAQLAWHPGGRKLAAASDDGKIYLFSRDDESPIQTFEGHAPGRVNLAFNFAGDLFASVGEDRKLRLWDPWTGRSVMSIAAGAGHLRFSRDDRYLAPDIQGDSLGIWEVASGREFRTIVRSPSHGRSIYLEGCVSDDGRLLAVTTSGGVIIWDLRTGEELVQVPGTDLSGCLFLPTGELLTAGARGVFGWPVTKEGETLVLGPPRQWSAAEAERLNRNRDGRIVASASRAQGAVILDVNQPLLRISPLTHDRASCLAVSPDGAMLATGTTESAAVRICETSTNRILRELEHCGGKEVAFSASGRWLATNTDGDAVQLWDTAKWTKTHRLPAAREGRFAFSPDDAYLAVVTAEGAIRLYEPTDGRLVADLENPGQDPADWLTFTPDGGRLIFACNETQSVHIWDLAELRRGLSGVGLNWSGPPTADTPPTRGMTKMSVVGINLLEPRAQLHWMVAVSTLKLLTKPRADEYCRRGAAWAEIGRSDWALQDFGAALRLRDDFAEAWFLRGMEHYRGRNPDAALEDFTKAMSRPALADQARMMRGKALLQLDRVEEMIDEVNALIARYPEDPQLYYQRALGHSYRDRFTEALADLRLALKYGPGHDVAMNNMAWILVTGPAELRDPEKAMALIQRAVKIAPTKNTYRNTLGVTLFRLGRYREAAENFRKSLEGGRGQFDAYDLYWLSMCQSRMDEPAAARESLERARDWQQRTKLTRHETDELRRFSSDAERLLFGAATPPLPGT